MLLGSLFCGNLVAQNYLQNPEHVCYDASYHRYLVTNYGNGRIVAIDAVSYQQEVVVTGLPGCLGIHIVDSVVYISHNQYVSLYQLETFSFIQTCTLSVTTWLDGMTDDRQGNLYVVENAGRIHRIDLTSLMDTIIVDSGLPSKPQDIAFDSLNNRLLVICWQNNSPLVGVDLSSFEVSEILETSSGQYDGIVMDDEQNLYITSWLGGGKVYKIDYPYIEPPVMFSQGYAGPAGLGINPDERVLAVPNFNSNSISYIPYFGTGIQDVQADEVIFTNEGWLNIQVNEKKKISVYQMEGKLVQQFVLDEETHRMALSNLIPSRKNQIYLLLVETNSHHKTIRIQ